MNNNPLLPAPIKARYPEQYQGLEKELLERKLVLVDGYFYGVTESADLVGFPPWIIMIENKYDGEIGNELENTELGKVIEILNEDGKKERVRFLSKTSVPLPTLLDYRNWRIGGHPYEHYFCSETGRRLPDNMITEPYLSMLIAEQPDREMLAYSLMAFESYSLTQLYWKRAGLKERFIELAKEEGIPQDWITEKARKNTEIFRQSNELLRQRV